MLIVFRDSLPIVVDFTQDAALGTFSGKAISRLLAFLNDRTGFHTNTMAMIIDIANDYKKILDLPDTPEADLHTFRITRVAEDIAKALYLKLLVGLLPPHPRPRPAPAPRANGPQTCSLSSRSGLARRV